MDALHPDPDQIQQAGAVIRSGGLVAFPTETVYGLGGDGLNPMSSKKIYAAKGRPSDNPLIIHIHQWESMKRLASDLPPEAELLANAFWPGPLTMIVKKTNEVPLETTGGLDTVAVRMPEHPLALAFIEAAGGFVAAPSANRSGKPSPTVAKYVIQDLDGRVDMILDGGEVGIGVESTIVDLTGDTPTILRPGYITEEMLKRVLGAVEADQTMMEKHTDLAPKAPGMKYRHYAPAGEMTLVEGDTKEVAAFINGKICLAKEQGKCCGVLCSEELYPFVEADSKKNVGSRQDELSIARNLYRVLREFDDEGVEVIYAESFSREGFGMAVMNRLLKAAGYHLEKLKLE